MSFMLGERELRLMDGTLLIWFDDILVFSGFTESFTPAPAILDEIASFIIMEIERRGIPIVISYSFCWN